MQDLRIIAKVLHENSNRLVIRNAPLRETNSLATAGDRLREGNRVRKPLNISDTPKRFEHFPFRDIHAVLLFYCCPTRPQEPRTILLRLRHHRKVKRNTCQ